MFVIPIVLIALSTGFLVLRVGLRLLTDLPTTRGVMWPAYWPSYTAFLVCSLCVHLPAFWRLRERLNGTRPAVVFPVAGALLAIVPIFILDDEVTIHSGGCKLQDRNLILIDRQQPPAEIARILARELSRYDLENLYILPRVREFIQTSSREKNLPQR